MLAFAVLVSLVLLLPEQNISESTIDKMSQSVFESPIVPTPTQDGLSPQAQIALEHIVTKYALTKESLQIVNEHVITYELIGQKYKAFSIWHGTQEKLRQFNLLVDMTDGHIEEDVNAVDERERSARRERYGKLQPDLYERIQQMDDKEVVSVAIIVVANAETQTQQQRFAALAAKYPEAV